ncbi:MAG: SpoIIE family protein phosphatase [Phycisphaera sp.]|nr:SpoIIE family protein phosphatase [Phycisphaera sp.]
MAEAASEKQEETRPAVMRLRIVSDTGEETTAEPTRQPVVVGRATTADVRVESAHVSRKHAEIYRDPFGRWWVRDLMSRAGTKVNGREVPEALLTVGDEILMGEYTLRVEMLQEARRVDLRRGETPTPRSRKPGKKSKPTAEAPPSSDLLGPDATIGSLGEIDGDDEPTDVAFDDAASSVSSLDKLRGARIESVHLATLKEFGDRLLRTPDHTDRLRQLCRLLTRRDFHGQAAIALRLERKDPRLRDPKPARLCEMQTLAGREQDMHLSRGLLRSVFESGLPMLATRDMSSDPGAVELSITWSNSPIVAMACPLKSFEKGMDVVYATFPLAYGDAQWLTLVALAAQQFQQAETVLDAQNVAREQAKIEEDLNQARDIQRRYVPREPSTTGLDVAIGFEPCRWVGGDLVDLVPLDGERLALVIADVSGKGLPAALISSNVYSMTRALLRAGVDLRTTIEHVNEHLREFLQSGAFVTLAAVVFDPAVGDIQSVNAGHPAPFIIGTDGRVRKLPDGPNMPLGIVEQEMECIAAPLEPGETLMMFTDGLSELRDENNELLGLLRLMEASGSIIHGGRNDDIDTVSQRLIDYLDETHGDHLPDDDRTFLLARRV